MAKRQKLTVPLKGEIVIFSQGDLGEVKAGRVCLFRCVSRSTRKVALQTIFTELKANTFRQRREVIRKLYKSLSFFVYDANRPAPTIKQLNRWMADVSDYTLNLSRLLSFRPDEVMAPLRYPKVLTPKKLQDLVHQLQELYATTAVRFSSQRGPKISPLALSNLGVIVSLTRLYVAATGKRSGHGRVHDHYDSARPQGSPTGPFFRLVKATLALVGGDKQGDEAIFRSIQDYNRQEKIRDFLEKVNADIAEDRAATLRAFLSKGEGALRRALRDHRARAEKLVDQAMAKKDQMEKRLRPYQRPIARRGPN